jgi:hypothetical protein
VTLSPSKGMGQVTLKGCGLSRGDIRNFVEIFFVDCVEIILLKKIRRRRRRRAKTRTRGWMDGGFFFGRTNSDIMMDEWGLFEEVPLSPPSLPLSVDDDSSVDSVDQSPPSAQTIDQDLLYNYVLEMRSKCTTVMSGDMQRLVSQQLIKEGAAPDWYMCMAWTFRELSMIAKAEQHVFTNLQRLRPSFRSLEDVREFVAVTLDTSFDLRRSDVEGLCLNILKEFDKPGTFSK